MAKCGLRALGGAPKTRSKSVERTMRPITEHPRGGEKSNRRRPGSDRQTLTAFGATCVDDRTAAAALHANEKPVRASTADFGSLVGAFHVGSCWVARGAVVEFLWVFCRGFCRKPAELSASVIFWPGSAADPGETEHYTKKPL